MPRTLLVLAALLGWTAVLTQFVLSIRSSLAGGNSVWHGIVMYFGYFTLLTNILCAAILTAFLRGRDAPLRRFLRRPGVVTAAATSIIVVGVVYHLLLAATWNPQGIDLVVDTLLHTVNPLLFVLAWTRLVPRGAVALRDAPWWALYILGYAAYILVRGAAIGEYPYPFIDVTVLGYPTALRNAALLGLAFVALSALMVGVNRTLGAPRTPET
ncbi:MAG: Pr6Pr family membrane protein [Gemmatimonadaceae bacterium]|nr:Pr6Pr family membrane protein [Gemmatimonadaceae bacterium]MCW5826436.1 Pr6Pr family membrane protein [Gemmatimonadaceae bacterium]